MLIFLNHASNIRLLNIHIIKHCNIHVHLYSYCVKTGQEGMLEQQNDLDISQIHLRSVFKTKLPFSPGADHVGPGGAIAIKQ